MLVCFAWLANGQQLGNHTFSHPSFSKLSLEDFKTETLKGEILTEKLKQKYGQKKVYNMYVFLLSSKGRIESFESATNHGSESNIRICHHMVR